MPKIREVLDYGCSFALPEDIVVYANADAGLTTAAVERIIEGISRGRGVTSCGNRMLDPFPRTDLENVTNCKIRGGPIIAMTPAWWAARPGQVPDMYIGREAWEPASMRSRKHGRMERRGSPGGGQVADIARPHRQRVLARRSCFPVADRPERQKH